MLEQARVELKLSLSRIQEAYLAARTILSRNIEGHVEDFVDCRERSHLIDARLADDTWHAWNR